MSNYLKNATTPATQAEQADPRQAKNAAGGFSFVVDDWTRLERFLILGSEGGTYYATERKLTKDNAAVVERLLKEDGVRLVAKLVEVSDAGRAPKNDPAILALAMAAKLGDGPTRRAAYAALPKVCRIGTHLYHFVQFANDLGGWGRGLRRAVANWFNTKAPRDLAYQLVKYQARDGWSSRDVLRLAHPRPATPDHGALYRWATKGYDACGVDGLVLPPVIEAFEEIKKEGLDVKRVISLIREYKLPREAVPTQHHGNPEVWEAMLPHMGLTALIRNLGQMTKVGLLAPLSRHNNEVIRRISDGDALRKARVHPIQILSALTTYQSGHSVRGSSSWSPIQQVVDALDAAFYASFKNVTPTGKPTLLAIDVSGSMDGGVVAGMQGITPRIGAAAMALVTANVEPNYHIVGFSAARSGYGGRWGGGDSGLTDIAISPNMRLDKVAQVMRAIPMGGTDCALPFIWAKTNNKKVESFAVYTDNETWAGTVHPHTALQDYRRHSGLQAKSAVVAFTAGASTIADPSDGGMMDFQGFDASAPAIMADFFRGGSSADLADDADAE